MDIARQRLSRIFFLVVCGLAGGPVRGELADLARLVPGDVLAAYMVDFPPPAPDAPRTSNSFDMVTVIIDQAFGIGVLNSLDIAVRGWLDAIASVSSVIAHSHAVMLFDLQVQRDAEDSHRVSNLGAAIVLRTRGENRLLEKRIQHLLGSYTNQSESALDTVNVAGEKIHRLRDQRLPDWCVICWGVVGDNFIVAIGEESMARVVAALRDVCVSLWNESPFRSGVGALAAENALITLHLAFDQVRSKSGVLGAKVSKLQTALTMEGCRRGLWAAGYFGKSLEIRQWLLADRRDSTAIIASHHFLNVESRKNLPPAAKTYAAIGVEPPVWFDRIRNAYLTARSVKNAAESRIYWREVEQDSGMRFAEFFSRLGGPIVVHDFPEHALRLPPAWTIVVPIRERAAAVREHVDALMVYWQKELDGAALQLEKTADGIWFMKVGLEGPALAVTDKHVLISFSPQAVRQNLELQPEPRP